MIARSNEAGFTFLELLVAIAILGGLSLIMAGGLTFGIRGWRNEQLQAESTERTSALRSALARLVEHAVPAFASTDRRDETVAFTGDRDRLNLVGLLPEALGGDVLGLQSLGLRANNSDTQLVFDWRVDLPSSDQDVLPAVETVLENDVRGLELRYWGKLDGETDPSWHDQWHNQTRLPEGIHIEVTQTDGAKLVIDARPVATVDPSCRLDPVVFGCLRP